MGSISEQHLLEAIHFEIIARDLYTMLAEKLVVKAGKDMMSELSKEEEKHRITLAARYRSLVGKEYKYNPGMDSGPDISFLKNSVFEFTQANEALRIALSLEIDSAAYYRKLIETADDPEDRNMLQSLIKFEESHKAIIKAEIKKLDETNHWGLKQ
jgi:rubrerythrin